MPLNTTPSPHGANTASEVAGTDPQTEYALLREELKRLLTEPVKDFERIDALVDQLERVQLAFKAQHGIKGNNPNE